MPVPPRKEVYKSIKNLIAMMPKTLRRCMKCQIAFESLGPHNRVCEDCNKQNLKSSRRQDRGFIGKSVAVKEDFQKRA